jgi:hypothetical protein
MTQKDRPKLPLLVLAAGGILLGAAALQSVLITVPGPGSSNPHAITVDPKPPAATPKPWDEPSPTVELAPAEPADPTATGVRQWLEDAGTPTCACGTKMREDDDE